VNWHALGADLRPRERENRRWPRAEPVLDRETVDGVIRKLIAIDRKVDMVVEAPEVEDDGGEEEMDS
jgi:hypothetical protein